MTDGIWDDGEWISWDEINDQLDEMELRENYSSSPENNIPPQVNTKKVSNKSKRNNSNTKNRQKRIS